MHSNDISPHVLGKIASRDAEALSLLTFVAFAYEHDWTGVSIVSPSTVLASDLTLNEMATSSLNLLSTLNTRLVESQKELEGCEVNTRFKVRLLAQPTSDSINSALYVCLGSVERNTKYVIYDHAIDVLKACAQFSVPYWYGGSHITNKFTESIQDLRRR